MNIFERIKRAVFGPPALEKTFFTLVVNLGTGKIHKIIKFDPDTTIKEKEGFGKIEIRNFKEDFDTVKYAKISWGPGGFPEWRKKQLKTETLSFEWSQIKGYLK